MKMRLSLLVVGVIITLYLVQSPTASAWSNFGTGSCQVAGARGVLAASDNPCAILGDSLHRFQVSLPGTSLTLGSNALDVSDVRTYFSSTASTSQTAALQTGPTLTTSQRDYVLSKLAGGDLLSDINLHLWSVCWQPSADLGISLTQFVHGGALLELPRSLGALVDGSFGTKEIELSTRSAHALAFSGVKGSVAYHLLHRSSGPDDGLVLGVSVAHLQGLAYASLAPSGSVRVSPFVPDGWDSTSNVALRTNLSWTEAGGAASSASIVSSLSGMGTTNQGYGVDFGFRYIQCSTNDRLSVGASVDNIGFIDWDEATVRTVRGEDTVASYRDIQSLIETGPSTETYHGTLRTSLGAQAHFGVQYERRNVLGCPIPLRVAAELHAGLNSESLIYQSPLVVLGIGSAQHGLLPDCSLGLRSCSVTGTMYTLSIGWQIGSSCELRIQDGDIKGLLFPSHAQWISSSIECTFFW